MKQRFPCIFVSAAICIMFFEMSFTASAQTQACAPPWQVGIPITVGEVLSFNGHNWRAIQGGYTTINGWEPPNTPALWSDLGPCSGGGGGGSCSASPSAPSGLSASATTRSGTTLSLSALPPPANCATPTSPSLENGISFAPPTATTFTVSGLAASTTYNFRVAASDSFGMSAQSNSVSVTTSAGGGGGGGGSCAPPWSAAT